MTGRTHDLAAFTALSYVFFYLPLDQMSLATLVVALGANFIGGLAPDLDQPTSKLWNNIRGGSILSRVFAPMLGAHRTISHSAIGIIIIGAILNIFLEAIKHILVVDMQAVWYSFMIGFLSHLATDTLTKEGIPLLFPIPIHFGIPPLKILRIKTGNIIEKSVIFPALVATNFFLYSTNYHKLLDFLQNYLHK